MMVVGRAAGSGEAPRDLHKSPPSGRVGHCRRQLDTNGRNVCSSERKDRGQRAQLGRWRKSASNASPAAYAIWDWVNGPDTRCADLRATAMSLGGHSRRRGSQLTQPVRFEARRQRVCVLRVAPILDVDRFPIRPGKAVDFLWGVFVVAGSLRPQSRAPRRVWKKSAPWRPAATAYGDSVAPDCCSSAALGSSGGRIAVPRDMGDGAGAKQRAGKWDFSARFSAGGAATRGARA